ncbi:MAG: hypothetical protein H6679_03305 [Epsilonproteobacteria bacterium]|nr:hypothetical protein [Campylobacterota bacterium]
MNISSKALLLIFSTFYVINSDLLALEKKRPLSEGAGYSSQLSDSELSDSECEERMCEQSIQNLLERLNNAEKNIDTLTREFEKELKDGHLGGVEGLLFKAIKAGCARAVAVLLKFDEGIDFKKEHFWGRIISGKRRICVTTLQIEVDACQNEDIKELVRRYQVS